MHPTGIGNDPEMRMFPPSVRLVLALSALLPFPTAALAAGAACERDFRAEAATYAQTLRLPGYAIAVAREGRVVYEQTDGYADVAQKRPIRADSIFPVASFTKTYTAAMMMQYVEEGRVRLDDYVTDYPQIDDAAAWLRNPDIRLRNILTHTSEGPAPGTTFSYNGNRFNYVYGVFARITGKKDYARAYAGEIKHRIIDRLGLKDTLPGFPDAANDARIARIVTPYRYDKASASFVADDDLQGGHRHAYPNSGMLSTLSDVARYIDALDRGTLIGKASVAEMTAPFVLNDGTDSPYGIGWYSETWNGTRINWVYGLGPSYSAFVMHAPSERLSLIFFANNDAPTAALQLGYGKALQFPLADGFLRCFAGKSIADIGLDPDPGALETRLSRMSASERQTAFVQITGIASTRRYLESVYGAAPGKALALVQTMRKIDPDYFRASHPELIALIRDIAGRSIVEPMNDLAAAYIATERIDPKVSKNLGDFYGKVGNPAASMRYRSALVAAEGFEANDATIDSAFALGDQHFRNGNIAAGRKYYWIGIRNAVSAGWGAGFAEWRRQQMNKLTGGTGVDRK